MFEEGQGRTKREREFQEKAMQDIKHLFELLVRAVVMYKYVEVAVFSFWKKNSLKSTSEAYIFYHQWLKPLKDRQLCRNSFTKWMTQGTTHIIRTNL